MTCTSPSHGQGFVSRFFFRGNVVIDHKLQVYCNSCIHVQVQRIIKLNGDAGMQYVKNHSIARLQAQSCVTLA